VETGKWKLGEKRTWGGKKAGKTIHSTPSDAVFLKGKGSGKVDSCNQKCGGGNGKKNTQIGTATRTTGKKGKGGENLR